MNNMRIFRLIAAFADQVDGPLSAAGYSPPHPISPECLRFLKTNLLARIGLDEYTFHKLHDRDGRVLFWSACRLRTAKTRGMLTRATMLTMVFKLAMNAQLHWRRLNRPERLGELIQGIKFVDGIREKEEAA